MTAMGSGFDLSVDIFSSEGRVFQVEYAHKAVDNEGTCVGVCCKDGVIVAAEKMLKYRMLEDGSNSRCHATDLQAGVCVAGNLGDGKAVVDRARQEATQNRSLWKEPMSGKNASSRMADFMHLHTMYWSHRPLGCSLLFASYADDGPQLYLSDPSGAVVGYYACAVGKAKTVAKTELEKIDFSKITCREAVKVIADIIYNVHDNVKDKLWDLEMAWVCDESNRRFKHVPKDLIPTKPSA